MRNKKILQIFICSIFHEKDEIDSNSFLAVNLVQSCQKDLNKNIADELFTCKYIIQHH